MKYFTPELYIRINSEYPDKADKDWVDACTAYVAQLASVKDPRVDELISLYLHDAELQHFNPLKGRLVLLLVDNDTALTLNYTLTSPIKVHPRVELWRFSTSRPCWAYEELDKQGEDFVQNILLSDGRVLEIPFSNVQILHTARKRPRVRPPAKGFKGD